MRKLSYIIALLTMTLFRVTCAEEKKPLPRIFITSIPKSGTHLLMRCVMLLTGKRPIVDISPLKDTFTKIPQDRFLMSHAVPCPEIYDIIEQENFKGIFIYRDPRDQLMSLVFWIDKYRKKWPELKDITIDEFIFKFMHGKEQPFVWLDWYKEHLPWFNNKNVYSTSFERLVGHRGGGDLAIQVQEITKIAKHIGYTISPENTQKLSDELYGKTGTFREGKIGGWKKYFSEEHKKEFKKVAGQLLIDLGYEKDFEW